MALTKVTYGLLSADTSAIDLNIDANTLYVDSSANSVGIGTNSPSKPLHVYHATTDYVALFQSGDNQGGISLKDATSSAAIKTQNGTLQLIADSTNDVSSSAIIFRMDSLNSGEIARFDVNGSLGIGTTGPSRKLHIKDNGQIKLENTGTSAWAGLDIHTSVGTNNYDMYMGMLDSNGRFFIDVDSNGEDLSILQNGNVGIGTTSPKTNLEVIGGLNVSTNTTSATTTTMRIGSYGASSQTYYGAKIVAHTNFTSTANTDLSFDLGNLGEVMRLHSNGSETRVGIKTTAPNGQLHIGDSNAEGSSANPAIQVGGAGTYRLGLYTDSEGGIIQNLNGDNGLQFRVKTAGEAMRIAGGTGDVLVGSSTNLNVLSGTPKIQVGDGSGHSSIQWYSGTSSVAGLYFGDASSGGGRYSGYIEYRHNSNSMAFRTNDSDRISINSDGTLFLGSTGNGYFRGGVENSFSSGWNANSDTHSTWINFEGYQGGTTKFRDLSIGNGKQSAIAKFDGSSGQFGLGTTAPTGQRLCIGGYSTNNSMTEANAWLVAEAVGGDGIAIGSIASSPYTTWIQSGYLNTMGTSNHYPIALNPHGGNVGIKNSSPTALLHLGANSVSGALGFGLQNDSRFYTINTDGGHLTFKDESAGSERMRLDSTGRLLIGTTSSAVNDTGIKLNHNGTAVFSCNLTSANENFIFNNNNNTGTNYVIDFRQNNSTKGSINVGGSSVAFNTSSDYRLKQNEIAVWDGTTILKQLTPYKFNWKADPTGEAVQGFFAHEVAEVVPTAVHGEKDGEKMQGIDHSKLVPLLVKTIQELEARITELESK